MAEQERLDRQGGNLAALEGALALLVEHLAQVGVLNKTAYITDLRRLAELPDKDADIQRAEQRLIRVLRDLGLSR
ncbi:hypothetical protein [Pseudomonas aeruginosa]|uniref:hypothetical protein n=1 Tax=Pseudomonas aeruginosa TaxID=287 RepID=UPI00093900C1|nr:hypothetical protein [Pseudomonas aeruginosa]